MSLVVVADQVVARRLPGGVESSQRHAEVGRAQHSVQGAGQLLAIEGPEERAGVDPQVGVDPAARRQVGAHGQDRVLGVDHGDIWRRAGLQFGFGKAERYLPELVETVGYCIVGFAKISLNGFKVVKKKWSFYNRKSQMVELPLKVIFNHFSIYTFVCVISLLQYHCSVEYMRFI